MFKKNVDIGSIIRKKVKERGMTVEYFSLRLGFENSITSAYSIFNKMSIDTKLLIQISEILDYDFLLEYYEKKSLIYQLRLIEAYISKIEEIVSSTSESLLKTPAKK